MVRRRFTLRVRSPAAKNRLEIACTKITTATKART